MTGLYVVGVWLAVQVASTFFPAWGIPDAALRYLVIAAILGFPVALVFSWFFDVTAEGIVRTPGAAATESTDFSLKKTDYAILAALAAVSLMVVYGGYDKVRQTTTAEIAASEKEPNSIAVLPFVNLDDDTSSDYFSDGVTEELLHRLSSFRSLRVLGRTSSFMFKNSDLTIPRISDALRVRYLLQGSVRREAEHVRVSAQLVDESGFQVWSETFDRKLEGIFSIQTDIANTVATQLVAEIAPRQPNANSTTSNIDAYQEYLIGRDFFNRREPQWREHASDAFRRSIDLDSDFAPPYAGLATAMTVGAGADVYDYKDRLNEAQEHIDRALALDPDLAEAHAAQGLLLTYGRNPDFVASEAALRRALDLDPTIVSAYNWLSIALMNQKRFDESWQAKQDALKIEPLDPIINGNVAISHSGRGDFHRAEQIMKRMVEVPDPSGTSYWNLYNLYTSYGRMVEANDSAKKIVVLYHGAKVNGGFMALSQNYYYLSNDEEGDYWHGKVVADDPNGLNAFFRRAYALKIQGRYDQMRVEATTFFANNPVDSDSLPTWFAEVLGAIKIAIGDYEEGILLTEKVIKPEEEILNITGRDLDAVDFAHQLAFAYQQTARPEKAGDILRKIQRHLQVYADETGYGQHPKFLELLAANQAMRGDFEAAAATFEKAVQTGWRHYFFVVNDPRWGDFFEEPAMKSLMAFVKADLDRQARIVEEADAEEDFRAVVEELDARGGATSARLD
ncbi:MAG: hypothetical protein ACR2RD_13665 [Woeseiaceae bacterium]